MQKLNNKLVLSLENAVPTLIGRGGTAEVYRCDFREVDGSQSKPIVFKRLLPVLAGDPAFRERTEHEARLSTQFDHPQIIRVFGVYPWGDEKVLVMEYIDGLSARDLVELLSAKHLKMSARVFLEIAHQAVAAVTYLHRQKILHRDISPHNILLSKDGLLKLTDFGTADYSEAGATSHLGVVVEYGKAAFQAPEVVEGAPPSFESDLFALGLTLLEIATGKRVIPAKSAPELREAYRNFKTPQDSEFPGWMPRPARALLRGLLERNPAQRKIQGLAELEQSRPESSILAEYILRAMAKKAALLNPADESESIRWKDRLEAWMPRVVWSLFFVTMVLVAYSGESTFSVPDHELIFRYSEKGRMFFMRPDKDGTQNPLELWGHLESTACEEFCARAIPSLVSNPNSVARLQTALPLLKKQCGEYPACSTPLSGDGSGAFAHFPSDKTEIFSGLNIVENAVPEGAAKISILRLKNPADKISLPFCQQELTRRYLQRLEKWIFDSTDGKLPVFHAIILPFDERHHSPAAISIQSPNRDGKNVTRLVTPLLNAHSFWNDGFCYGRVHRGRLVALRQFIPELPEDLRKKK